MIVSFSGLLLSAIAISGINVFLFVCLKKRSRKPVSKKKQILSLDHLQIEDQKVSYLSDNRLEFQVISILSDEINKEKNPASNSKHFINLCTFNYANLDCARISKKNHQAFNLGPLNRTFCVTQRDIDCSAKLDAALKSFLRCERVIALDAVLTNVALPGQLMTRLACQLCRKRPNDVILIENSCLFVGHSGSELALLVEKNENSNIIPFSYNELDKIAREVLPNLLSTDTSAKTASNSSHQFNQSRIIHIMMQGLSLSSGQVCPLTEFVELRYKYRNRINLVINETVSMGALGHSGRGIVQFAGLPMSHVDFLFGSLECWLGVSGCAYLAGLEDRVEFYLDVLFQQQGGKERKFVAEHYAAPYDLAVTALQTLNEHFGSDCNWEGKTVAGVEEIDEEAEKEGEHGNKNFRLERFRQVCRSLNKTISKGIKAHAKPHTQLLELAPSNSEIAPIKFIRLKKRSANQRKATSFCILEEVVDFLKQNSILVGLIKFFWDEMADNFKKQDREIDCDWAIRIVAHVDLKDEDLHIIESQLKLITSIIQEKFAD